MTALSWITEYVEPLVAIVGAAGIVMAGWKKLQIFLKQQKIKKIDRLRGRKELIERMRQSPTELLAYLGDRLFGFAIASLFLIFLIMVGVFGVADAPSSKAEDLFFRSALAIEIAAVAVFLFVWAGGAVELCRAVRDPKKAFKMLDDRISAEGKKLGEPPEHH